MPRQLASVYPGSIIWLEYNGTLEEWIVMEQKSSNTILLRNKLLLARRMHSSNVSVYDGCEMDTWLSNEEDGYLAGFDNATRSCLVADSIQTYVYGDTEPTYITRRCYLPSNDNLFANDSVETEKSWFAQFIDSTGVTDFNQARIGRDASGTAQNWWLRSPASATAFRYVYSNGNQAYSNATSISFVRPTLSVASATIVSDEGADIIRLLPDPSKTYREVSMTGFAGSTQSRPNKARVIVDAVNLYDVSVMVSNNAKDANPVWVDATGGIEAELTNTAKTSENWEIGVKLYGKSDTVGYFTEPAVLVEVD